MRAGQRKPVHVLVDLADIHLPAADGVAVLTNRRHLAPVDVGMAVSALVADIRENHLHVAGRAGHAFVHATQREAGGVVIELGNGPDRFPAVNGVTVLAGQVERTVGTMAVGVGLLRLLISARCGKNQQQRCYHPKLKS